MNSRNTACSQCYYRRTPPRVRVLPACLARKGSGDICYAGDARRYLCTLFPPKSEEPFDNTITPASRRRASRAFRQDVTQPRPVRGLGRARARGSALQTRAGLH